MVISVKDYLSSMKTISSSVNAQANTKSQSDLKTQQLLSQLIEAISYANSMKFNKKELNSIAKGSNPDKQTTKQVLDMLKQQEKLIEQLAQGQKLSNQQSKELNNCIDRFYEAAGAQEINYKKFASSLEKFALAGNLPGAVQTRLINDSRDAHVIGKEQKDKDGILLPIVKKIRNLLEDSAEVSKQFGKKLFVTLDKFREDFLNGLSNMVEELTSFDWLNNILKKIGELGSVVGMLGMAFGDMFKQGNFKWGQLTKQIFNIKDAFKAFKDAANVGKTIKGPVKAIKDLVMGAKLIGKNLASIPKMISKLGFGKGLGKAAGGIGKGLAKGLGKGVLKKIPLIGTLLSIWMGIDRWKKQDYAGALIELASGVASIFPGVGTIISIGLDLVNLGRDTGFFKNIGDKAKTTVSNMKLGEDLLLSLPVVGPIVGIIKSIKAWNSGNKKGALELATKSFLSLIPGGAFVGDLVMSLFNLNAEGLNKPDTSSKKSGGFKWPWQKGDSDQKGDGTGSLTGQSTFSNKPTSTFAKNLAGAAERRGGRTTKSSGTCALAVGDALSSVVGEKEASKFRGHAWQWISRLKGIGSKYFKFAGIAGSNAELRGIPAGSIAVWDKQAAHPYGHIEIADGKGHLISDFKRNADLNLYRRNPAGIKPMIFTPKDMPMPALSGNIASKSGQEETSSAGDMSTGESTIFDDMLSPYMKMSQDIMTSMMSGIQPVLASAMSQDGMQVPSLDTISSGTPSSTAIDASKEMANNLSTVFNNANKPAQQQQVVQPVQSQGNPDTIDTEIKDTDLAILNSLLFQS